MQIAQVALLSCFALSLVAPLTASPRLPATVTWLGNSYPGGQFHVPQDIDGLCATPDGRVFSNVYWEEGGGNVTQFKDGKVLGAAGHTHGWGNAGGRAVACNSKYLFIGCRMQNEGGGLNDLSTWPPKGKQWLGISRRPLDYIRKAASFPGGKGGKGDTLKETFLVVAEVEDNDKAQDLPGIVATETRVYVSCPAEKSIKVYDAETMQLVETVSADRPGPLALSADAVWMLQEKQGNQAAKISQWDTQNKKWTDKVVFTAADAPCGLAISPSGYLMVPDQGPRQQVRIYGLDGAEKKFSLGVRGGLFASPVGKYGALRFNNPSAVACDAQGRVYVAHRGSSGGGSTVLECYLFQLNRPSAMQWRLFGLNFVDMADVDPADDTRIFTKEERFSYDYTKSGTAAWNYAAYTINPWRFSQDPRMSLWSAGAWVRRISGQPYLFVNDMNAEWLQLYRFEGEIAVPSVLFAKKHIEKRSNQKGDDWPPNQPAKGKWIWSDKNRDGAFDANEFETRPTDAPSAQGWWVDDNGGVWLVTEKAGLRYFPCQTVTKKTPPAWSYASMQSFPAMAEFSEIKRVRYDVKNDVLYLGGTTTEHKNQHWKPMGPVIARYDGWLKGEKKLRWQIVAPYQKGSAGHESCEPMGFDIAGDYLFVPYTGASKELGFKTGHIEVFRAGDGQSAGNMEPGEDIGEIGLQDIRECLRAHQRKDGEYIVFLEEDFKAKILMYRWKP